jgi:catechol 2,3-dioxygenase-like lactoylglutathione lyase family enzyme
MIRHIAGVAEIVDDIEAAVRFYRETLGLEVDHTAGEGYASVSISGVPHFGIWLRSSAAKMVFGDPSRTDGIALGFTVGFEVDSVAEAESSLRANSTQVIQGSKLEPWGQQTARFLSPSGGLCEFSETPAARRIAPGGQPIPEKAR